MDRATHLYMPGTVVTSRLRTSGLERLIQNLATPIMTKLRDVSGETVALHFVSWPDRVVVAEVVSNRGLRAHPRSRTSLSAYHRSNRGRVPCAPARQ